VDEGLVIVGAGVADWEVTLVSEVSSLQPNQPGVLQVDVDVVVVDDVVVVGPLVVLSSKQPHHPGVLQVSVRVLVDVEVEVMLRVVVEDSVPLLSKNSQG